MGLYLLLYSLNELVSIRLAKDLIHVHNVVIDIILVQYWVELVNERIILVALSYGALHLAGNQSTLALVHLIIFECGVSNEYIAE